MEQRASVLQGEISKQKTVNLGELTNEASEAEAAEQGRRLGKAPPGTGLCPSALR